MQLTRIETVQGAYLGFQCQFLKALITKFLSHSPQILCSWHPVIPCLHPIQERVHTCWIQRWDPKINKISHKYQFHSALRLQPHYFNTIKIIAKNLNLRYGTNKFLISCLHHLPGVASPCLIGRKADLKVTPQQQEQQPRAVVSPRWFQISLCLLSSWTWQWPFFFLSFIKLINNTYLDT